MKNKNHIILASAIFLTALASGRVQIHCVRVRACGLMFAVRGVFDSGLAVPPDSDWLEAFPAVARFPIWSLMRQQLMKATV
jgi:hypothetical protein